MALRILVSVTTDLVTDQRVHKISSSLHKAGYEVHVAGRQMKASLPLNNRPYQTTRFRLWFEKGFLFYAAYNIRLFFFLLFTKADILMANDLDTLLPNYIVSKLKGIPLAYDNHEYFTSVPELIRRPFVRGVWKSIERFIFPRVKFIYTDNDAKQGLFESEYKVPVRVVKNVPIYTPIALTNEAPPISIPSDKKVIIYQGTGINVDRGTEELTQAMKYLDDSYLLLFVGSGDVIDVLKEIVAIDKLENRVWFTGKVPMEQLPRYTRLAHLGISFDKPISDNYIYSLPNKIFDYVHSGVPVLCSRLPEVERMVTKYQIGGFIETHEPQHIAARIRKVFEEGEYKIWQQNLIKASEAVNWQNEEKVLLGIYEEISKTLSHHK